MKRGQAQSSSNSSATPRTMAKTSAIGAVWSKRSSIQTLPCSLNSSLMSSKFLKSLMTETYSAKSCKNWRSQQLSLLNPKTSFSTCATRWLTSATWFLAKNWGFLTLRMARINLACSNSTTCMLASCYSRWARMKLWSKPQQSSESSTSNSKKQCRTIACFCDFICVLTTCLSFTLSSTRTSLSIC